MIFVQFDQFNLVIAQKSVKMLLWSKFQGEL